MDFFLVLKGTNKDLAIKEFEYLWKTYFDENISLKRVEGVYYFFSSDFDIFSSNFDYKSFFNRLTLTNSCFKVLWEGDDLEDLNCFLNGFDFSFLEGKSFAIGEKNCNFLNDFSVREIAKPIWLSLKNPSVDLSNPDFLFSVFNFKNFFFVERIFLNDKSYLNRMPKKRPIAKPYTLKSDIARASCNLLSIKSQNRRILDPFCGIGGILLEAYDMGFSVYGNDIFKENLDDCIVNFDFYFPEHSSSNRLFLKLCDAREECFSENFFDGIVTDIPYGKSCRRKGDDLYDLFLKNAHRILKKGHFLVVIYANFLDFKNLALKYFKEVVEIDQYINKSMTRHILVLKK